MLSARYRWLVPAGLAGVVYMIGSSIEASVIDKGRQFSWSQAALPLIVSAGLGLLAGYWYRALPRDQKPIAGPPVMPRWQGYGVAALSIGWFALAAITWFLTDLKSPFLTATFVLFGVAHIAGGVGVVRQHQGHVVEHRFGGR